MNNQNSSRKRRTVAFTPGEVAVPRRFISAGRAEVSFSVWRSLSLACRGPNRANARRRGGEKRGKNGCEGEKWRERGGKESQKQAGVKKFKYTLEIKICLYANVTPTPFPFPPLISS